MPPSPQIAKDHDPDVFGIEINFEPHSSAPARVFRTMTALIDAFQEIDGFLAQSVTSALQPVTLLEDIEAGSLRAWLRNSLDAVDDDTLKSGDYKKLVGVFLVKAKRVMIKWTENRTEVTSASELVELQRAILKEALETEPRRPLMLMSSSPVPTSEIARSVELISNAVQPLGVGDSIRYLASSEPPTEFNTSFRITPGSLTELLVNESLVNEAQMILMVRRPDFLGGAKWEFRHGNNPIPARIMHAKWMAEFRSGVVPLLPGDALRAKVRTTVRYGYDGDVIDSQHEVVEVIDVIRAIRPTQEGLF